MHHYRCARVYTVKTGALRTSGTLSHFPNPLFHWEAPAAPLALPPTTARPTPAVGGSDLIGRCFMDPELGRCKITGLGSPYLLRWGQGNRADGATLTPGWHNTLRYVTPSGAEGASSVAEVAQWVEGRSAQACLQRWRYSVDTSIKRGKWTPEEEAFTSRIIHDFTNGYLPLAPGTTLRSYLSEKLNWWVKYSNFEFCATRI